MTRSLFLCIVLLVGILQQARPDEAEPLKWPNGKYYEKIGRSSRAVFAPADVVSYLSKSLVGDSTDWFVIKDRLGPVRFHDIVVIEDQKEHIFVFEITENDWILINNIANKSAKLNAISNILEDLFKLPPLFDVKVPAKTDTADWLKYFDSLSLLYGGYPNPLLLSDTVGKAPGEAGIVDNGDMSQLKALCKDPIIEENGSTYTVSINMMPAEGGVEHWSVTFQKDSLKVIGVNVTVLYPPGTFTYLLPPD